MTEPTLHRLLWGPTPRKRLAVWTPRPWEVPAVGLPVRVAAFLYSSACRSEFPSEWSPEEGPLTWLLDDTEEILGTGRLSQFDLDPVAARSGDDSPNPRLDVRWTTAWEVAPHEAYFLPLAAAREAAAIDRDDYALYCGVLLLITAIDGGEAILAGLAERGIGAVPFVDRWAWRSRIHLPEPAWNAIDSILRRSATPEDMLDVYRQNLARALEPCCPETLASDDFEPERVDIAVGDPHSTEIARTVRQPDIAKDDLPEELHLDETRLVNSLLLRVGQTQRGAKSLESALSSFPAVDPQTGNAILEQVAGAFQSPHHIKPGRIPDLVVFPELAVPQPEARTVRDLVAKTGIASISGLYWQQLKPVYAARGSTCAGRIWFANEAEIALPVGHGDSGPASVRWYRVRKPLPAHVESGLASALGCSASGRQSAGTSEKVRWAMLKGRRWYRFLHAAWGDFTVAICSDLLDAAPWHSLKGEIMHLFMVARNRDVELFDTLTWVRAYENFANVITVNDGCYGGTVLWTPKRHRDRELSHVRGSNLSVIADVEIPVKNLFRQQRLGVRKAECLAMAEWLEGSKEQHCLRNRFKPPPPGFVRRAFLKRTGSGGI